MGKTSDKDIEENKQLILNKDLEGLLAKNHYRILGIINWFHPPNSERNDYWAEARIGMWEAMITHDIENKGWAGWFYRKIFNRLKTFQQVEQAVRIPYTHRYITAPKKGLKVNYLTDSFDEPNPLTNEPMYASFSYDEGRIPDEEYIRKRGLIHAYIDTLEPIKQKIFHLRMTGMKIKDIAEELGTTKMIVQNQFYTITVMLKRKFGNKIIL